MHSLLLHKEAVRQPLRTARSKRATPGPPNRGRPKPTNTTANSDDFAPGIRLEVNFVPGKGLLVSDTPLSPRGDPD